MPLDEVDESNDLSTRVSDRRKETQEQNAHDKVPASAAAENLLEDFGEEVLDLLDVEVESQDAALSQMSLDLQIDMLRGRLARRNKLLEVVRRAYYSDILVVKEQVRQYERTANVTFRIKQVAAEDKVPDKEASYEDSLSGIPSVDLREVLPLFAPTETYLKAHPCDLCGGHLELIHQDSRELVEAKQESVRAVKAEKEMRHQAQKSLAEMRALKARYEEVASNLVSTMKDLAYTKDQLERSRNVEQEQKSAMKKMSTKLHVAKRVQEELDKLKQSFHEREKELKKADKERRSVLVAKEKLAKELEAVSKTLHETKEEQERFEASCGSAATELKAALDRNKSIESELKCCRQQLAESNMSRGEIQESLSTLKKELALTLQRFDHTKRHLEDRLVEEEHAREEVQEQNTEYRKANKKLLGQLEEYRLSSGMAVDTDADASHDDVGRDGSAHNRLAPSYNLDSITNGHVETRIAGLDKDLMGSLKEVQEQLEQALMRENDLLSSIVRSKNSGRRARPGTKAPIRRAPSSTLITRFVPTSDGNENTAISAGLTSETGESSISGMQVHESVESDSSKSFRVGGEAKADISHYGNTNEVDDTDADGGEDNDFEMYHRELQAIALEIEAEKREKAKLQKIVDEYERKQGVLQEKLDDAKLTIETFTEKMNSLKMQLNQGSAGSAQEIQDLSYELDETQQELRFETERGNVLINFLTEISGKVFDLTDNRNLLLAVDIDRPHLRDDHSMGSQEDSVLSADVLQKKRTLRRKVLMDRATNKFAQQCKNRGEVISLELRKMREGAETVRNDLAYAEDEIDACRNQIRNMEAETAKLQLSVEIQKTNLVKSEKTLCSTKQELDQCKKEYLDQLEEFDELKSLHSSLTDDHKRLTLSLFEKTAAWEKALAIIKTNQTTIDELQQTLAEVTAERNEMQEKVRATEEHIEFRRQTDRSIGISAIVPMVEEEVQTDRWRPPGLVLRQRNAIDRMPQRYLGRTSVLISCPDIPDAPPSKSLPSENQEMSYLFDRTEDNLNKGPNELPRPMDGRRAKTSQGGARPNLFSRFQLSSDGITQKYRSSALLHDDDNENVATGALGHFQSRQRPFTTSNW